MAIGYCIFVLIFPLFFESIAQIIPEKTTIGPMKTVPGLSDAIQPTPEKAGSTQSFLREGQSTAPATLQFNFIHYRPGQKTCYRKVIPYPSTYVVI
ncbi:hypothetical protein J2X69_003353 [Algoriphagus sp. 4150]|uniref:hypothetical protein n=1 Tax=Algoriphagus sp. 4150 TaxID=2817756 RepID=UPI0028558A59|nr:hypothetical protein [Algoriphagus sp. 4150]MDR7130994.1 hypothetical protein [Algoriphagus sp. 4150]